MLILNEQVQIYDAIIIIEKGIKRIMKKTNKVMIAFLVAVIFIMITSVLVYATYVESQEIPYFYNSNTYYGRSICESMSNGVRAVSAIRCAAPVGANQMGTRPRLYNENGAIISTSGWAYNSQYGTGSTVNIGTTVGVSPGYYFSKGEGCVYNGNGYTKFNYNRTPNIWAPDAKSGNANTDEALSAFADFLKMEYKINENGQTYGSELFAPSRDYVPELILAIGDDGTEGYIKKEELYNVIDLSYEEVMAGVTVQDTFIPLYQSDGKTIIGNFIIRAVRSADTDSIK